MIRDVTFVLRERGSFKEFYRQHEDFYSEELLSVNLGEMTNFDLPPGERWTYRFCAKVTEEEGGTKYCFVQHERLDL